MDQEEGSVCRLHIVTYIEPTFINIEIALHTAYIRHAIVAFFYVRFEIVLFRETCGSVTNFDAQFPKMMEPISNLINTESPHHPKDEIWSFIAIFIV